MTAAAPPAPAESPEQVPATVEGIARAMAALPTQGERVALLQTFAPEVSSMVLKYLAELAARRGGAGAAAAVRQAVRQADSDYRPKTDDELWEFVRDECGIEVPRVAVVPGNRAPFELLADIVFERGKRDKIAIGNRGSGKTKVVGTAHAVKARTQRGWSGATVGAIEPQAKRCYAYFKQIVSQPRWVRFTVKGRVLMGGTEFVGGGKVEIIVGTLSGVNSPHPHFVHFDEVELFREGVYEEGVNMAQGDKNYRAMNVLTSSWKFVRGFVTTVIRENREHIAAGLEPPYEEYRWGVWETTANCAEDCGDCPFKRVVRGKWDDGSMRTFESICKQDGPVAEDGTRLGKLKLSEGFIPVEDTVSRFQKLSRRNFQSQQESKQPTAEGLVYGEWEEERFGLESWTPDPALGPIRCSIDFGGTDPHAAGCWQRLDVEVELDDGRRIPQGASILFAEVYKTEIGNVGLGLELNDALDSHGVLQAVDWFVGDSQQKSGRLDLSKLHTFGDTKLHRDIDVYPLPKPEVGTRIAHIQDEVIGGGLLWVVLPACPNFLDEIGQYELEKGRLKGDDHHMDEMGYYFWRMHLEKRRARGPGEAPRRAGGSGPRSVVRAEAGAHRWNPDAAGQALAEAPIGRGSRSAPRHVRPLTRVRSGRQHTGSPFG